MKLQKLFIFSILLIAGSKTSYSAEHLGAGGHKEASISSGGGGGAAAESSDDPSSSRDFAVLGFYIKDLSALSPQEREFICPSRAACGSEAFFTIEHNNPQQITGLFNASLEELNAFLAERNMRITDNSQNGARFGHSLFYRALLGNNFEFLKKAIELDRAAVNAMISPMSSFTMIMGIFYYPPSAPKEEKEETVLKRAEFLCENGANINQVGTEHVGSEFIVDASPNRDICHVIDYMLPPSEKTENIVFFDTVLARSASCGFRKLCKFFMIRGGVIYAPHLLEPDALELLREVAQEINQEMLKEAFFFTTQYKDDEKNRLFLLIMRGHEGALKKMIRRFFEAEHEGTRRRYLNKVRSLLHLRDQTLLVKQKGESDPD